MINQRDYDETVASALRGIHDVEAGRVTSADEVFSEVRHKSALSQQEQKAAVEDLHNKSGSA